MSPVTGKESLSKLGVHWEPQRPLPAAPRLSVPVVTRTHSFQVCKELQEDADQLFSKPKQD